MQDVVKPFLVGVDLENGPEITGLFQRGDGVDEEGAKQLLERLSTGCNGRIGSGREVDRRELEQAREEACIQSVVLFSTLERVVPFSGRLNKIVLRCLVPVLVHSTTHTAVSSSRCFLRSFAIGYCVTRCEPAVGVEGSGEHSVHRSSMSIVDRDSDFDSGSTFSSRT